MHIKNLARMEYPGQTFSGTKQKSMAAFSFMNGKDW